MQNLALTCRACDVPNVWPQTIDRTWTESDRMIAHFVCPPCLFKTDAETMIDSLPDYETMPETMPTVTDDPIIVPTDAPRITRNVESRDCSKVRLPELFRLGLIRKDDRVECGSHTAYVVNAASVQRADGSLITWNRFGQLATGHKAVNIYKHILVNDILLESLRMKA